MENNGLFKLLTGQYSNDMLLKEVVLACRDAGIDEKTNWLIFLPLIKYQWRRVNESGQYKSYYDADYIKKVCETKVTFGLNNIITQKTTLGEILFYFIKLAYLDSPEPMDYFYRACYNFQFPIIDKNKNEIRTIKTRLSSNDVHKVFDAYKNNKSYLKLSIGEVLLPISL